ncbi:hypothetical protein [Acidithiobacillus thiooxidans]|uniref:hypothetical protein n=1 Tax=Acidithiobacillus thiooxidans TaxID=930 RepID=UPI00026252DF|nr:hypothetical protein [Acidithiobacillus thiooxidans]
MIKKYNYSNRPSLSGRVQSRRFLACSLAVSCAIALGAPALSQAATPTNSLIPANSILDKAIANTKISAMVGLLNFSYLNHAHTGQDTHSLALGGHLYVHSPQLAGFSLGVGGDFATWTGFYQHEDPELTGPYPSHGIAIVRQAYLQYHYGPFVIRGGRQFINTPYANWDYYTYNPRAFTGVSAVVDIIGHPKVGQWSGNSPMALGGSPATLSFMAARMYSYASRYSATFTTGNRYTSAHTNGFYVLGARYQTPFLGSHVDLQAWYYDFYGFANMFYGQAGISHPLTKNVSLFGNFQVVSEGNSGAGTSYLNALNADSVDAQVYGGRIGIKFGSNHDDNVALVASYSPVNYNSFRHGGMIHPYNDLSGTSYTTTMQTGISDFGPGYAYGIASNFGFLANKLKLNASFIRYLVRYGFGGSVYTYNGDYGFPTGTAIPDQHLWSMDVGLSYDLSSILKGLYVADYTDISMAQNEAGYPHYQNPYFSNRFYFKYRF